MNRSATRRLTKFLFVAAPLLLGSSAQAQSNCSPSGEFIASLTNWNPPLDRRVSLHVRDISLREALDRLSAATKVRLSYETEAVPLDSRVCASFDSLYLGEALGLLLRGTSVLPVAAGGEHVVLTPIRASQESDEAQPIPRVLDRVVVTGNAVEAPA